MRRFRLLIVDDSPTMRRLIRATVSNDPRIEVVAEAANASQARDAVNLHRPDVITLDVEMPHMSGLEFLRRLMRHRPMPVIMVSTLTAKGSRAAIEALALGAVDCIEKPRATGDDASFARLADTIVMAAGARVREQAGRDGGIRAPNRSYRGSNKIALLGGSTGAVDAIETILRGFPVNCPPTLIVQHMPAPFLESFAARLDPRVAPHVRLARNGDRLTEGEVLIAPGGAFHLELRQGPPAVTGLVPGPEQSGHRPSVDALFNSALPLGPNVVATILTGMGRDGAAGMRALRDHGAYTIGQTAESCVIFGMPRVAGEMGGVQAWVDLPAIADAILDHCAA